MHLYPDHQCIFRNQMSSLFGPFDKTTAPEKKYSSYPMIKQFMQDPRSCKDQNEKWILLSSKIFVHQGKGGAGHLRVTPSRPAK